MPRLRALLLVATCVLSFARPLAAQRVDALPTGIRVRVFPIMTPPIGVTGTVIRVDSTTLVVQPEHATTPVAYAFDALRRVQVSRSQRSRVDAFGRGARIGAIIGGAIGVVTIGAGAISQRHQSCDCFVSPIAVASVLGAGVTILTTTTGGLIGLASRERWAPWSIPSATR